MYSSSHDLHRAEHPNDPLTFKMSDGVKKKRIKIGKRNDFYVVVVRMLKRVFFFFLIFFFHRIIDSTKRTGNHGEQLTHERK